MNSSWTATRDLPPRVVVDSAASEALSFARDELTAYLGRILGNVTTPNGPLIVLRVDPAAGLSDEGFEWEPKGDTLSITAGGDTGIVFAVYAFLREVWGCSFAGLGPDSEDVPALTRIDVERESGKREPLLWYRGMQFSNVETPELVRWQLDWMAKNGLNYVMYMLSPEESLTPQQPTFDPRTGEPLVEFDRRSPPIREEWFNRFVLPEARKRGLKLDMNHHNLSFWLPPGRYFHEHPEWYSLVDGQRGRHFMQLCVCTSNEEAVRELIHNVLAYLRSHPEVTVLGVVPEDGHGMCQCPACVAQDPNPEDAFRRSGGTDHRSPDHRNPSIAVRYAKLLNRVARAVRAEFPGVLVGGAAYVDLQWPPRAVELEDNIVVWVALYWRDGARTLSPDSGGHNAFFFDVLRQWREAFRGKVIAYEYYMGMGAQRGLPYPMSRVIAEEWPRLRWLGIEGATIQCPASVHQAYALNMLVFARSGWERRVDRAKVLDEFLRGMFGAAAAAVRCIYTGLLDAIDRMAAHGYVLQPSGENIVDFISHVGVESIDAALERARVEAQDSREQRQIEAFARYWEYCKLAARAEAATREARLRADAAPVSAEAARIAAERDIEEVVTWIEQNPMPGWVTPMFGARWKSQQKAIQQLIEKPSPAATQ